MKQPSTVTRLSSFNAGERETVMQIPEKSISIPTDKFRLTQVITNFLSNAIKFTQKGYILIGYEYREEERHVHIS